MHGRNGAGPGGSQGHLPPDRQDHPGHRDGGPDAGKGGVGKAVFYLDSPVSNSGRLKERIGALLEEYPFADFAVSEE